jgi:hypothetical protein
MPDNRTEHPLDFAPVHYYPSCAGVGPGTRHYCDFALALLADLAIDRANAGDDVDAWIEILPEGNPPTSLRVGRLGGAIRRGTHVLTLIMAPLCSMLLNIDAMAIARGLGVDPALRGGSRA